MKHLILYTVLFFFLVSLVYAIGNEDEVLILANNNTISDYEIATYYADARGIPHTQICNVSAHTGEYGEVSDIYAIQDSALKCICTLIDSPPDVCNMTTATQIRDQSPITHLVLLSGMPIYFNPPEWKQFVSYFGVPVMDYYVAAQLYQNYTFVNETSAGSRILYHPPGNYTYYSWMQRNLIQQRMPAYARLEAMNVEQTKSMIDRTIAAEKNGLIGNVFYEPKYAADTGSEIKLLQDLLDVDSEFCQSHINGTDEWNSSCILGITNGQIPGESNSRVPIVINASLLLGKNYNGNGQSAFDGYTNMLRWKTNEVCEPLCKNLPTAQEQESCRLESKDYFKELNSACVGGTDQLMTWQYRSFPVQGMYFPIMGFDKTSGRSKPQIFLEDGYIDDMYTDTYFLRIGRNDTVENQKCVLANQTVVDCENVLDFYLQKKILIETNATEATFSTMLRNKKDGKFLVRLEVFHKDSSNNYNTSYQSILFEEKHTEWVEKNITFQLSNSDVTAISIQLIDQSSSQPRGYIDLDRMQLYVDHKNIYPHDAGSFNMSHTMTAQGDWASNVISRLGGVATWGSASHYDGLGHAFNRVDELIGHLFAGKTLATSLLDNYALAAGLIFADPLFKPFGVKVTSAQDNMIFNDPENPYTFYNDSGYIRVTAFNGENSSYGVYLCAGNCTNNKTARWQEIKVGNERLYLEKINITEFGQLYNRVNYTIKVNVTNNRTTISNYGHFKVTYLDQCLDEDGDGFAVDGEACGPIDCFDNDSTWYPYAPDVCHGRYDGCPAEFFYIHPELKVPYYCAYNKTAHILNAPWFNASSEYSISVVTGYRGIFFFNETKSTADVISLEDGQSILMLVGNVSVDPKKYTTYSTFAAFDGRRMDVDIAPKAVFNWNFRALGSVKINHTIPQEPLAQNISYNQSTITLPYCYPAYNASKLFAEVQTHDSSCYQLQQGNRYDGVGLHYGDINESPYYTIGDFDIAYGDPIYVNCGVNASFSFTPSCPEVCHKDEECSEVISCDYRDGCYGKDYYDFSDSTPFCSLYICDTKCDTYTVVENSSECVPNIEANFSALANKNKNISFYVGDRILNDSTDLHLIDVKNITLKRNNMSIVRFKHNFSEEKLNVSNVSILYNTTEENKTYLVVQNLNLTQTKELQIKPTAPEANALCFVDAEVSSYEDLASCTKIACPGVIGSYECAVEGEYFILSGLHHSGVVEDVISCGNAICEYTESCSSCAADCGECPASPSSGGSRRSSGGGGGFSFPQITINETENITENRTDKTDVNGSQVNQTIVENQTQIEVESTPKNPTISSEIEKAINEMDPITVEEKQIENTFLRNILAGVLVLFIVIVCFALYFVYFRKHSEYYAGMQYVKEQRKAGFSDSEIKQRLYASGWTVEQVDEILTNK